MSVPPPPNQWGSQPPTGGQPGARRSGDLRLAASRVGLPQWGPQQPWGPPPGPPPRRGGKGKWIFGRDRRARGDRGDGCHHGVGGRQGLGWIAIADADERQRLEFASANDKGPVDDHHRRSNMRGDRRRSSQTLAECRLIGWAKRDPSIPAARGPRTVRSSTNRSDKAMRSAADQMVSLVKLTPHRVMRELYEQFIAYARAYADRIPTYTPQDDNSHLHQEVRRMQSGEICSAIAYGSASARGPLVRTPVAPSQTAPIGDPARPPTVPHRYQSRVRRLDVGVISVPQATPLLG